VADRRSDSYFDFDISGAWLHLIGAKSLKVKKWAHDRTMPYAHESKEQIIDLCKALEV
jgi:hypothetical protein